MEVVRYFKYIGGCFNEYRDQYEDVRMMGGEGLRTFGAGVYI